MPENPLRLAADEKLEQEANVVWFEEKSWWTIANHKERKRSRLKQQIGALDRLLVPECSLLFCCVSGQIPNDRLRGRS
jgi:hypothetical protein